MITKNENIVHQLLEAGGNPNVTDKRGCTAMHLAVKHNSKKCLMLLFKFSKVKLDLNAKNYDGEIIRSDSELVLCPRFDV